MRISEHARQVVVTHDWDTFQKPVLNRSYTRDQIEYIQRLMGKNGQQAMNVAIEIIGDMEKGTHYPPAMTPAMTGSELAMKVGQIIDKVTLKKTESS